MAYQHLMDSATIPENFGIDRINFGNFIVTELFYNIHQNFQHNDHPFHKYAKHNRNQCIRNLEDSMQNNNGYGEQILEDYFRSNSIYHDWLQTLLDSFVDYAISLEYEFDD